MYLRALKYLPATAILHVTIGGLVYAQTAGPTATGATELTNAIRLNTFENATLDVYLKGADGKPVEVAAVVTLLQLSNEAYRQETAKAGHVRFQSIKATEYFVQVIAPGYQTAVKQVEARKDETRQVTIELRELSVEDVAENAAYRALAPKAQKEIGKALERLRAQKLDDARSHLDAANRAAPNRPRCNTFMVFTQSRWGTRSKPSRTGRRPWNSVRSTFPPCCPWRMLCFGKTTKRRLYPTRRARSRWNRPPGERT